jgi:transposase InsO family protein
VSGAFAKIRTGLRKNQLFHTDRGSEFKNKVVDKIIETFQMERSLSNKGCPVAEATFKLCKIEFVNG